MLYKILIISEDSLNLVLLIKVHKSSSDIDKAQIKSEKITPFGGIYSIMEQFDALLFKIIDSTLGKHCQSFSYSYSEILRSLMCVFFCGGSCIKDVSTHLMKHLSPHPRIKTCSADTYSTCHKRVDSLKHNLYVSGFR